MCAYLYNDGYVIFVIFAALTLMWLNHTHLYSFGVRMEFPSAAQTPMHILIKKRNWLGSSVLAWDLIQRFRPVSYKLAPYAAWSHPTTIMIYNSIETYK